MAEPTDEQLREYAAKLPDLYRETFEAFYRMEPNRHDGAPLRGVSLVEEVAKSCDYAESEVAQALDELIVHKFLLRAGYPAPIYLPTALGERLMTVVTGKRPRKRGAPPLPKPTWK